jgi:predicted house-cleaning noncanonical NTP pyrophosphatase (MazG superfamily)
VELIQEEDGIRDPGATQPRTTLYHKMVEEYWHTKMMISKLRDENNEISKVENHGHKKELIEILSILSNLEASVRRIVEDQRSQNKKME